ncbi:MAG: hypothetical protein H6Q15_1591 [Bacteroidetes bacterium]|nr:hypothetical protein [Bacteroidota bacterium]
MIRLLKEISQEDNILGDFCTDLLDDSRFRVLKTKKEKIDYISGLYGWHCSEVDEAILEVLGILGDSYSLKKLKVINDRIKGLEEDDDEEEW